MRATRKITRVTFSLNVSFITHLLHFNAQPSRSFKDFHKFILHTCVIQ